MCIFFTLPEQPKRYVCQADDKEIPCLGVPFTDLHFSSSFSASYFIGVSTSFVRYFRMPLYLEIEFLFYFFPSIKFIIITTELDVSDGFVRLISFILGA